MTNQKYTVKEWQKIMYRDPHAHGATPTYLKGPRDKYFNYAIGGSAGLAILLLIKGQFSMYNGTGKLDAE